MFQTFLYQFRVPQYTKPSTCVARILQSAQSLLFHWNIFPSPWFQQFLLWLYCTILLVHNLTHEYIFATFRSFFPHYFWWRLDKNFFFNIVILQNVEVISRECSSNDIMEAESKKKNLTTARWRICSFIHNLLIYFLICFLIFQDYSLSLCLYQKRFMNNNLVNKIKYIYWFNYKIVIGSQRRISK